MSAPRAIAGGIYYLSGVLVKAETKEVAKKLIAKGFRTATDGIKNSGLKVQTVTNNNFVTFVTRALKKAIEQNKKIRQGPKIDPKTGRPVSRKSPEEGNLLGNRGQSEFARKYGSRKMGGFGPVKSTRVKEAKDLKLAQGKRAKAKAESSALKLTNAQRVFKPSAKSSEAAGNRSGSTPTIVAIAPNASSADEASSKIPSVQTKARKTSTQVQRKARADAAAKRKAADKKIAAIKARKTSTQVQREARADAAAKRKDRERKSEEAAAERKRQKLAAAKADAVKRDTPDRKKTINLAVRLAALGGGAGIVKLRKDAEKKALTEVLNKKIASRKSTAAKEKAKARAGEYKSLASAKKAGSLYYMHKGKELRAAITREEIGTAYKRISGEAMKKIAEGK